MLNTGNPFNQLFQPTTGDVDHSKFKKNKVYPEGLCRMCKHISDGMVKHSKFVTLRLDTLNFQLVGKLLSKE